MNNQHKKRLATVLLGIFAFTAAGLYCCRELMRIEAFEYFIEAASRLVPVIFLALGGGGIAWWSGSQPPNRKQKHVVVWWGVFNVFLLFGAIFLVVASIRFMMFSMSDIPVVAAGARRQLPGLLCKFAWTTVLFCFSAYFMASEWRKVTASSNESRNHGR